MYYTTPLRPLPFAPKSHKIPLSQISVPTSTLPKNPAVEMELPANPIPAVVLLLSLLAAAAPPVSAILKTCTITYDDFINSNANTEKLYSASKDSTLASGALHVTLESDYSPPTNQSGRILYDKSFKLWEGRNDTYSDRVASFNTSFLVILSQKIGFPAPGEGLTFVVAPDLNLPPNSFGRYLGLTNFTTDGNVSNQIIAIELDTFKEDFDPDSNHVGLNINSVISKATTSLTPLEFELVPPYGTHNFFNVWVQYDGIKKFIAVYMAKQANPTDPTPPRPDTAILTSGLDLRGVVNQNSYFGFSASTGNNSAEINRVLRWNLTVEYYYDVNFVEIGLIVGIPTVVLLLASLVLVYYFRKRWLSRRLDRRMSRKVKGMPGMPREYQYKDLQKATNNFDKTRKLGQGGYGVVYKGYLANQKDLEVAVKLFSRESLKGQDDFFQELTIINQLRHKNLIPLLGWCHNHGKLLLVYDYMPNGSLDKHLFGIGNANSTPLSWNLRRKIITGVASALFYLNNHYNKRVIHRDVKASNIMLDAEFNPKLGDFGLARTLDYEKTSYTEPQGVPGTPGYMAPEYMFTGKATEQSDVYAFGAVLLEVVCGRMPKTQIGTYSLLVDWVWALHSKGQLLKAVDSRLGEDYVAEEAQRFLLLGLACSHPIASARPKAQEIVQMLSGSMPAPHVPLFKPPYVLVPVLMLEEDIIPATTTDTMFFTAADCRSGSAPVAINLEIQRPYSC
ncbi:probable L-type lectin-domain containing receptor kinase S.5 [Rhododendron vialii]|uniref:probable L-type lectin-domain containing receptor kinase S.5 n=1 Tax=Rhododendron vialii TaxID=182163 RepID=UPI00265EF1ED|nr:probable L-type lectin-domain containing receptor kinase S.5 [Rhododendron vialii]